MTRLKIPRFVLDRLIRRKARLHETPLDKFEIRVAHTTQEHEDAFRLVNVAYIFGGIEALKNAPNLKITPQHVLPESTILVAYEDDRPVGTLTVTLDSRAGLCLDNDYHEELEALRQRGCRLVEYGSFAVVKRCQGRGVNVLLNIAAQYLAVNVLKATHCVVGVHPKAEPIYRALFNFEPLGPVQRHAELNAPVRGLVQDIGAFPAFSKRHHPRPLASGFTFGEHCYEVLPSCIPLPPFENNQQFARWKLPRSVFRELFISRSNRLETLKTSVRLHLTSSRSQQTLYGIPALAELGSG